MSFGVRILAMAVVVAGGACTFDTAGVAGGDGPDGAAGDPDALAGTDAPASEPDGDIVAVDAASFPDAPVDPELPDAAPDGSDDPEPPDASVDPPDAAPPVEICDDGDDNDLDGDVDCQDADCPACGTLQMCCPDGSCALVAVGCLLE